MDKLLVVNRYNYAEWKSSNEIVRQFMKDNSLILYGGTAIDYSLRIYGSKIYEDYELADYDFYSADNAIDAYKIFTILKDKYTTVSVMPGMHPTTMRVRVGFEFVADVSYCSKRQYEFYKKTALNYDGILVRHPYLQYADMHRAFAFPYEGAPNEVILSRWKKDYERMCMLMKCYPVSNKSKSSEFNDFFDSIGYSDIAESLRELSLETELVEIDSSKVNSGMVAFWVYYCAFTGDDVGECFLKKGQKLFCDIPDGCFPSYIGDHEYNLGSKNYSETIGKHSVESGIEYITSTRAVASQTVDILGTNVTIVSLNFLIIHFYTLMIKNYTITRTDKTITVYMGLYFQLLIIAEKYLDFGEDMRLIAPCITSSGKESHSPIEIYLLQRDDTENIKPPSFNAKNGVYTGVIPAEFKFSKLYFQ